MPKLQKLVYLCRPVSSAPQFLVSRGKIPFFVVLLNWWTLLVHMLLLVRHSATIPDTVWPPADSSHGGTRPFRVTNRIFTLAHLCFILMPAYLRWLVVDLCIAALPVMLFAFDLTMPKSHGLAGMWEGWVLVWKGWQSYIWPTRGFLCDLFAGNSLPPNYSSYFSTGLFSHHLHSTYSSYSRGASTLVPCNIPFSCALSVIDPHGRCIFLLCNLEGLECIVANIYTYIYNKRCSAN